VEASEQAVEGGEIGAALENAVEAAQGRLTRAWGEELAW
jgi:hypothetical protein